jgi:hypothetical protein
MNCGTGTVELELWNLSYGTGTVELDFWNRISGTGNGLLELELHFWNWNCGTGTLELNSGIASPSGFTLTWWAGLLHRRMETKNSQNAPTFEHPNLNAQT